MLRTMSVGDPLGLVGATLEGIRVDACIRAGAISLVYHATRLGQNEPVALKVLRLAQIGTDPAALVGRFRDETKILQHLTQGNLDTVRCFGAGEAVAPATRETIHYMVLEWLEGRTLAADLEDRRQRRLPGRHPQEALDLLELSLIHI